MSVLLQQSHDRALTVGVSGTAMCVSGPLPLPLCPGRLGWGAQPAAPSQRSALTPPRCSKFRSIPLLLQQFKISPSLLLQQIKINPSLLLQQIKIPLFCCSKLRSIPLFCCSKLRSMGVFAQHMQQRQWIKLTAKARTVFFLFVKKQHRTRKGRQVSYHASSIIY